MSRADIQTVDYSQLQDSQKIFDRPASLSSHSATWNDIVLEYHVQPGCDTGEWVAPLHRIAINMPDRSHYVERWLDSCYQSGTVGFGDMSLLPAGVTHRTRWEDEAKFLIVCLDPVWLKQLGEEMMGWNSTQLIPKSPPLRDELIQGISVALKQALEVPSRINNLYVDQLKITLGLHLLREYATCPHQHKNVEEGLSAYQQKLAISYIHSHLSENIKLSDIASVLGMSRSHFCRQFRNSMGITPYQYVIQKRIELAKSLLRNQRRFTIAEIALECGFSSQSHLSQHFHRLTGITPKAYLREHH